MECLQEKILELEGKKEEYDEAQRFLVELKAENFDAVKEIVMSLMNGNEHLTRALEVANCKKEELTRDMAKAQQGLTEQLSGLQAMKNQVVQTTEGTNAQC